MLQYNDKVFQIGTMRIFNFLMYREDIKSYLTRVLPLASQPLFIPPDRL